MLENNERIEGMEKLDSEVVEKFNSTTTEILEKEVDSESYEQQDIEAERGGETQITELEVSKSEEVTPSEDDIVQYADVDCEDDTKDENRESQNLEKSEIDSVERINSEISNSEALEQAKTRITDLEASKLEEFIALEDSNVNASVRKFSMIGIQKPDTKAHEARKVEKADFSVVNTSGNGKRLKFSKELLKKLGLKSIDDGFIDIGFTLHEIVVSTDLSGIGETFHLSKGGHIYSKDLVEEISKRFKLDFNRITTRSFSEPEYQALDNGRIVAIIKM